MFATWGKKTVVTLLAGICLCAGASVWAQGSKEARAHYKKGLWAFRAGNTLEAISRFQAASEADPDFHHPLLALGRVYQDIFEREMRFYVEASRAFEKLDLILIANPPSEKHKDLYQGYYYEGLLHLKGGDYAHALLSLNKFIEIYPDFEQIAEVHNAIGIAHYYLDQYDRAVIDFKRALEVDPTLNEARFNLRSVFTRVTAYNEALVLHRAGEPHRALRRLEGLRDIAPRYLPGRALEAKLLAELDEPQEAMRVYREILGFYPNHPRSYWLRIDQARTLIKLERYPEAQLTLMENLARFPNFEDEQARREVVLLLGKLANRQ